jgi:hypothetical protein
MNFAKAGLSVDFLPSFGQMSGAYFGLPDPQSNLCA